VIEPLAFRPTDAVVRALAGQHLPRRDRLFEAIKREGKSVYAADIRQSAGLSAPIASRLSEEQAARLDPIGHCTALIAVNPARSRVG
jgi:hypothetical protein